MKIGILTLHYSHNYGAVLQCFALCKTLKNMGLCPMLIDRQLNRKTSKLSFLQKLLHFFRPYPFFEFKKKYLKPITREINNDIDMLTLASEFDAVIVGSDQVWRKEYTDVGYNYFLDFVDDKTKKIAYAASFGKDNWQYDEDWTSSIKKLLIRFSNISVREFSGIQICQKDLDCKNVEFVLDPTLLLDAQEYKSCFSVKNNNKDVIASYILDNTDSSNLLKKLVSKETNLLVLDLLENSSKGKRVFKKKITVNQWINSIANSKLILTDSYHGMLFSIIFNKQFIVLSNNNRGKDRFTSILKLIGLENRILSNNFSESDIHNLLIEPIDYNEVNIILEKKRTFSLNFLEKALIAV